MFVTVLAVLIYHEQFETPLYVRKNAGHIPGEFEDKADKTGMKTGTFASGLSGIRRRVQIVV